MTATTTELAMSETPDISVVIPLLNESESLPELAAWIDRVMTANRFRYEAIFIDDGRIQEDEPPQELFTNPKHPRLKAFLSKML